MEKHKQSPSLKDAVRKRSTATAIRLGGILFLFFCLLFFYQRFHQKSQKIEQKITIDQEFLGNALRIGDLFFVTQYLSSFADSQIITAGGIREKGKDDWIVSIPKEAFEARSDISSLQILPTGFQFFDSQEIKGGNGGVWEIHYFYKVSYSLFFDALIFSILIGFLVFLYITYMLNGVVGYFNDPVLNISKDLEGQSINTHSTFEARNYELGKRFQETDQFVEELKDLVGEINIKNQKLKEAEIHEAISRLSRQVDHDIKSPLGALKVSLESLSNNPEASKKLMTKSIARIENILSDLKLSKNENVKKELITEKVNITEFLRDLIEEKKTEYQAKAVELLLHIESDELMVEIDSIELARAISNIINNAIEAGREESGTQVQISCQEDGSGHCKLSIKDNGPGVPQEIRSQIFEYGVSGKEREGAGTGLSQAMMVAQAHGGSLSLESDEKGLYRVFKLTVPM